MICRGCFEKGHGGKDCPNSKCMRCGGVGHVLGDCVVADVQCSGCNEKGHVRENCPERIVEERLGEKEEEIAKLKMEVEGLRGKIEKLKSETTESGQTISQHQQDVTGLLQDVKNYRVEVEALKQEKTDLRKESEKASSKLESTITDLKQENKLLEDTIGSLERMLDRQTKRIIDLKDAPMELEVENNELKEEIELLSQNVRDARAEAKTFHQEMIATKEKRNDLRASLIKSNERNKAMEFSSSPSLPFLPPFFLSPTPHILTSPPNRHDPRRPPYPLHHRLQRSLRQLHATPEIPLQRLAASPRTFLHLLNPRRRSVDSRDLSKSRNSPMAPRSHHGPIALLRNNCR